MHANGVMRDRRNSVGCSLTWQCAYNLLHISLKSG